MNDLLRLITLSDASTRTVVIGTSLLGVAAASSGSFMMLRRRSLVGDALAHAALPGICLAYLVVGGRGLLPLLAGALVSGLVGVGCIAAIRAWTRIKEDAAIGIVLAGFFGLGIALSRTIQNLPGGNRAGLDSFIFGKAASMVRQDAISIAVVATVAVAMTLLLFKEWKLVAFDRAFAAAQGWPTLALDLALMALVCVVTVIGLPAVGVVLMVALLVAPAAAARFWTDRLGLMITIAACIGALSGLLGTALSATLPAPAGTLTRGWPTGPLIALVAGGAFAFSLLAAPRRGVVAGAIRRIALRRKVAAQNLLRSAFEAAESRGGARATWSEADLPLARSVPAPVLDRRLARARRVGLVESVPGGYALTDRGAAEAARVARAHRLWEMYLITHANIAADHVDRDADQIEHILPPETLARLEAELRARGRGVPDSPHRVDLRAPSEVTR